MTTMKSTFDAATTEARAAHARKRMSASACISVLLAGLGSPTLRAEAAPFQQYVNGLCFEGYCQISFAPVPTGKRLELYNTSCHARQNGARGLVNMGVLVFSIPEHLVFLAPEVIVDGDASKPTVYAANHSILAYVESGQRLAALVSWNAGVVDQFACHISGQMLDAPR